MSGFHSMKQLGLFLAPLPPEGDTSMLQEIIIAILMMMQIIITMIIIFNLFRY